MPHSKLKLKNFFDLAKTDHEEIYEGADRPWEALSRIGETAEEEKGGIHGEIRPGASVGRGVKIKEGTMVKENAVIKGPAVIGRNCEIRPGAFIRGNVIIGDGVVVGHSTEIKNSLIHREAEIPHFSYVGDSIIGWKGHLAAGVKVSNLKINREPIKVKLENEKIHTGLRKFGCILGDEAEIGCNSVLNPGTLVGKETLAMANTSLSGYYPPGSFVKLRQKIQVVERREEGSSGVEE